MASRQACIIATLCKLLGKLLATQTASYAMSVKRYAAQSHEYQAKPVLHSDHCLF
jgi:hypothetical protein